MIKINSLKISFNIKIDLYLVCHCWTGKSTVSLKQGFSKFHNSKQKFVLNKNNGLQSTEEKKEFKVNAQPDFDY